MNKKENLILVHSFPTNSILLKGLVHYLEDHFTVYFIDLPGFSKLSPLNRNRVNLNYYSEFVTAKIKEFKLPHYIIGGISFGFIVVNEATLNPNHCKGILALEPYLNSKYLNISFIKRFLYTHLLDEIEAFKLSKRIWENPHAGQILSLLTGEEKAKINTLLQQLDYRSFFQTARILVKYNRKPRYKNIPYVLWINLNDTTIKSQMIIDDFQKNAKHLLVKYNEVEHYPKEITKKYFKSKIKKKDMLESIDWINKRFINK